MQRRIVTVAISLNGQSLAVHRGLSLSAGRERVQISDRSCPGFQKVANVGPRPSGHLTDALPVSFLFVARPSNLILLCDSPKQHRTPYPSAQFSSYSF